ncbi:restriction endonuclease [Saliphagus infecundisoli]|uniref:Restriction endonuclease n=1 Tax=Saliphagus infecundisoli TaxID=1849069 RepID=A0ABD5QHW9_9EURY|nr:restriction endonuclease [Saliphagus infecundisoli]
MGIFDWGSSDDELLAVQEFTQNAQGKTVTKDHLTRDFKKDSSVLSYLRKNEQPHFILWNRSKGLTYNEKGKKDTVKPPSDYRSFLIFTDQRVIFLIGSRFQRTLEYDDLESIDSSSGIMKHRLSIKTLYANYEFYVSNSVDSDELRNSTAFLQKQAGLGEQGTEDLHHAPSKSTANPLPQSSESTSIPKANQNRSEIFQRLRQMDPYDFEHFVADLWRAQGWETTVSQESVDQGVDIVATKKSPFPQKQVIQVKRYAKDNTIGSPKVQQYSSLRQQEEGADVSVIVTTSSFTRQAEEIAQNLNVKLVDADDIYTLLEETDRFDLVSEYAPLPVESRQEPVKMNSKTSDTSLQTQTSEISDKLNESGLLSNEKECPSCGEEMTHSWRKDIVFPAQKCNQCDSVYYVSDDDLTSIDEYLSERDSNASKHGYYGIVGSVALSVLSFSAPIFGLLAWILFPLSISRDTQYIRGHSGKDIATGYWVWGAAILPVVGAFSVGIPGFVLAVVGLGIIYYVQRYRIEDVPVQADSDRIIPSLLEKVK